MSPSRRLHIENTENIEKKAEKSLLKSTQSFQDMPLHPKLMQAITACRYDTPTEIQQESIPAILEGRDLMASAQTGSGKTLAFVLPSLQLLLTNPAPKEGRGPRVLILTPTRELATQITQTIAAMSKFAQFRFGTITGGVGYRDQEQMLKKPFDILVATPGRLMDHMEQGRVDFSRLSLFILDEADRMLDMGFVKDMEHIAAALPEKHQTLLFSATLEGNVQKISKEFLKNPVRIQLTVATKKHTLITQRVHMVDNFHHKRALLAHVLEDPDVWQAIVFTGTKRSADELVEDLANKGIASAVLHGDIKQSKRTRTLEQMHRGKIRVLVATDVAARGIDIKRLSHVINFDLPRTPEDYIHRIGRTGRCGEKGIAISLAGPKDSGILSEIERVTGQKLQREVVPGFESKSKNRNTASSSSDARFSRRTSSSPRFSSESRGESERSKNREHSNNQSRSRNQNNSKKSDHFSKTKRFAQSFDRQERSDHQERSERRFHRQDGTKKSDHFDRSNYSNKSKRPSTERFDAPAKKRTERSNRFERSNNENRFESVEKTRTSRTNNKVRSNPKETRSEYKEGRSNVKETRSNFREARSNSKDISSNPRSRSESKPRLSLKKTKHVERDKREKHESSRKTEPKFKSGRSSRPGKPRRKSED